MRRPRFRRRSLLSAIAASSVGLAGCQSSSESTATATVTVTSSSEQPTPTQPPNPATLEVRELTVPPDTVAQLDTVSILTTLANTGDERGRFTVELRMDGTVARETRISLAPGEQQQSRFELEVRKPGRHTVHVGDAETSFTVAETLFVADVRENVYSYWERLLFTCLQGIANRSTPRIYLLKAADPVYDREWLDWYRGSLDKPVREVDTPYRLFDLPWSLDGYVVVDRWAPDTANVSASITATDTDNVLPVTEALRNRTDTPDLDVAYDLREEYTGRSKHDIYQEVLETQWQEATDRLVCKKPVPVPLRIDVSEYTASSDTIYLRFEDATKSDGFGSSLGALRIASDATTEVEVRPGSPTEREYIHEDSRSWLWKGRRRIADKDQYWIYEFDGVSGADTLELYIKHEYLVKISTSPDGPFEEVARGPREPGLRHLAFDNTIRDYVVGQNGVFVDLSSSEDHERERALFDRFLDGLAEDGRVYGWTTPRGGEHDHVYQVSENGRMVMPTANASNFSMSAHLGDRETFTQPSKPSAEEVTVEETVYVTFVMSDGDAPAALDRFLYGNWLDESRGEVPIGWEVQPLLADVAPGMLEYFYETATENDTFMASASGIGYTFPDAMSAAQRRTHLDRTKPFLERTDLTTLTVLHHRPIGDAVAGDYASHLGDVLHGVMEGYWDRGGDRRTLDGLVWMPTELPNGGRFSVADIVDDFEELVGKLSRRPAFVPVHVPTTQNLTTSDVVDIVDRLDAATFTVVPPDEFFVAFDEAT